MKEYSEDHQSRKAIVKKKIMFNKEIDYYFITYNVLILLWVLNCTSSKNKWSDFSKLVYILPYVSDSELTDILVKALKKKNINQYELDILRETYLKSKLKAGVLSNILFALDAKGLIVMKKNEKRHTIDLWLNMNLLKGTVLFKTNLFELEISNVLILKEALSRLRYISVSTLLERIYSENGVRIWEG